MQELVKKAKLRAMNLLTRRDYSEHDLRCKLDKDGYPGEVTDAAIEYVRSFGYVDDLKYAGNYIRSCIGGRSRREIELKLKEKGIPAELIEQAMEQEYQDDECEDELIRRLIHKRCKDLDAMDHNSKQKLYAYMYNKGFSVDRVRHVLDELLLDITS